MISLKNLKEIKEWPGLEPKPLRLKKISNIYTKKKNAEHSLLVAIWEKKSWKPEEN